MNLKFEKEIEDVRGRIIFYLHGKTKINLIETRNGFALGGHHHKYGQDHTLISGKI